MKVALATCVLVLGLVLPLRSGADYKMSASVFVAELDPGITDSFEGDPVLAPQTVSVAATLRLHGAEAAAAPFALQTFAAGSLMRISEPNSASASFSGAEVVVQDSPSLRSLISPEGSTLDLLLNFRVVVAAKAATSLWFDTAYAMTGAAISTSSLTNATVEGDHYTWSLGGSSSRGIFSGMTADGGEIDVALPIRISPFLPHGLTASINAQVHSDTFAWYDELSAASSAIQLSLVDGPGALTLPSGETLTSLGVNYEFSPEPFLEFVNGSLPGVRHITPLGGINGQFNPILPNLQSAGFFQFFNALSGNWFDPPLVDAYDYRMISEDLFTDVFDFPTGFDSQFVVSVEGTELPGRFGPGNSVRFVDFADLLGPLLIDKTGVRTFRISGISPLVDADSDIAFPIKLGFSAPIVDFEMKPVLVPEPSAWAMALGGVAALICCGRSRRRTSLRAK